MITPRLQAVMDLAEGERIADIGTDHAYIPIQLALEGRIKKAIAADKNTGPIKIAEENIKKYSLGDIIDTRVGDGLDCIKSGEADTVIIAGMGGKLIGDIIERDIIKARSSTLILQPMNAQYELRKRLFSLGFKIEREQLAKEGFKVYNIIKAVSGQDIIKEEIDYHLPKELYSHPLFKLLAAKKEREFKKIINGMKKSDTGDIKIINKYEALLSELYKIVFIGDCKIQSQFEV